MITVILTIHILIVLGLIGVVLLQRSEGGALGMGGAGSGGGFMTGRGAANVLTRTTSVLAALFFATSLGLAIYADRGETEADVIEGLTGEEARDPNAPQTADDLLRTLGAESDDGEAEAPEGLEPGGLDPAPTTSIEDALDALGAEPVADPGDEAATADESEAEANADPQD